MMIGHYSVEIRESILAQELHRALLFRGMCLSQPGPEELST